MSRFNAKTKTAPVKTTSYEGGTLWEKKLEEEWVNFLFSSMLTGGFYESDDTQIARYLELTEAMLDKYGADFVAKAAVFSRNELGLRTISQLTAAKVNDTQFENKRYFFSKYFRRVDNVAEVFGAVDAFGSGKRSHALVRGAADYLSRQSAYSLGKYKMSGKEYNLFDLINITHAHSDAIDSYKRGTLETPDTWETAISASKGSEEKAKEWTRLVEENRLGYLALIRNLRNIVNAAPSNDWIRTVLCPAVENEAAIRKSLIFPYQIYVAWFNLGDCSLQLRASLDTAFRIAVENMPELEGDTAIILDVSGSMDDRISDRSNIRIKQLGAVYGVAIYLKNPNCKLIKFGNHANEFFVDSKSDVFTMIERFYANDGCGYGTDIAPAVRVLEKGDKTFARIFLISDMQIMDPSCGSYSYWMRCDHSSMDRYMEIHRGTRLYSYDLGNYKGKISKVKGRLVMLTGLSDKVFEMIQLIENGGNLVDMIRNYTY